MATVLGTTNFDTYANYQLAYDLISQSTANNTSKVRLYGILNVTGSSIGWSSGTASVHTASQGIGTSYARGSYTVIQRDFTFTHDSNGNFSQYISASINTSYKSGTTGGTLKLPKINRYPILNSGTNFTDEENPVYNITAYNTFPIRVKLEAGGNTQLITRDLDEKASTVYTLELTDEERDTLRALIPNSNSLAVKETVCAMSGSTELNSSSKSYTMSIVNGNPVFSNFEFEDVNPITLALTGNKKYNINGYSNIKVTIPELNKAKALKNASMSKYRFSVGDSSTDIGYSDNNNVSGTINGTSSGTYNVYAIDSRNNSTLVTKLAEKEIAYEPIYLNKQGCSFLRDNNNVGNNAILTLNGIIWNNTFGLVTNSIKKVIYRLKKTDSNQWISGTTNIVPTLSENNFVFQGLIASDNPDTTWDLDASYDLEVIVNDELSSASVSLILNSAIPTISLDKNGVGIMCAYDPLKGGSLQIDGDPLNIDISDRNIYSTDEEKIGTYLNKPLYRKMVKVNPTSASTSYNHEIEDLDIVVDLRGFYKRSGSNISGVIPMTYTNWQIYLYDITDTKFTLRLDTNQLNSGFEYLYVIIEYTKKTD